VRTPFRVFATLVEPPLMCIALLGVLVRGATCASLERERGTWDGIVMTPVSAGEIIAAKVLGCVFCVRWIWLLVGLLWSLGVISGQLRPAAAAGTVLLVTVLALSAAAVGMLLSARLKSSLRAVTTAVGLSLLIGGGYLFTVCVTAARITRRAQGASLLVGGPVRSILACRVDVARYRGFRERASNAPHLWARRGYLRD
jgi:ABC-type transport system involved in multi-copper enzyme maturation permease subunit